MSSKSTKKQKKLSVPRELPEIEKENKEYVLQAGQLQYQIIVSAFLVPTARQPKPTRTENIGSVV